MAERKLSKRVMENDITPRSLALDDQWDMSIFRSDMAMLPKCIPIETTVETNDGKIIEKPKCPPVPAIENGMMVCSTEQYIGSICRLVCDDHFIGHGYGDKNVRFLNQNTN